MWARSAPGSRAPAVPSCSTALAPLAIDTPPFTPPPPRSVLAGARWVRPELVIRAEFAGWTGGGSVRQASYKGFDLGKDARLVVREVPGPR